MADEEVESVESFRDRIRIWAKENLPLAGEHQGGMGGMESDEDELKDIQRNRDLQRKLFDGGFAGIIFPKEYGGAGLTPAHQRVMNDEMIGYQFPNRIQVPTFSPVAAVILEFGNEEQKQRHLPKILSGEELWMQMLSEPGAGSDLAGATTTAVRDGDMWVVNGSKIWTSGAWWSDYALMLARTNWDVPKHRGLSVFMIKIHQPGIEVKRIEQLNGANEFCQEFITDVQIPDIDRIGEVDDGWTVGTRWLFHEKSFNSSPFILRPGGSFSGASSKGDAGLELARSAGRLEDPLTRQLIGKAHALSLVGKEGASRIGRAIGSGQFKDPAAGMVRVLTGVIGTEVSKINFEIAGAGAVAWEDEDAEVGNAGIGFLMSQTAQIGGGTTEMSRNTVSERFLGMPSEARNDRDMAFRDVPRGPSSSAPRRPAR